jgi:hypothetical protein
MTYGAPQTERDEGSCHPASQGEECVMVAPVSEPEVKTLTDNMPINSLDFLLFREPVLSTGRRESFNSPLCRGNARGPTAVFRVIVSQPRVK